MRQVFHAYKKAAVPGAKTDLKAFGSRLRWQGHFIQKFEAEDRMEFESVNRGYRGLFTKEQRQRFKRGRRE